MLEHPGSRGCYQQGCREPQCKKANNEYCYTYRVDKKIIQYPGVKGRPRKERSENP